MEPTNCARRGLPVAPGRIADGKTICYDCEIEEKK